VRRSNPIFDIFAPQESQTFNKDEGKLSSWLNPMFRDQMYFWKMDNNGERVRVKESEWLDSELNDQLYFWEMSEDGQKR